MKKVQLPFRNRTKASPVERHASVVGSFYEAIFVSATMSFVRRAEDA